jgi:hypothetical protein
VARLARSLPLLLSAAAAGVVLFTASITADPSFPLVDGFLDPPDTRTAAKVALVVAVFFLVLIGMSITLRFIERGNPNSFQFFGFQLDWTPEQATELRGQYEALSQTQQETALLLQDTIRRVKQLEDRPDGLR